MALTELQMPTKDTLYRTVNNIASEMRNNMARWKLKSEFIADLTGAEMTTLGVPSDVQSDLSEFRTALDEVISFFEGNAVTATNNPQDVMDLCRMM